MQTRNDYRKEREYKDSTMDCKYYNSSPSVSECGIATLPRLIGRIMSTYIFTNLQKHANSLQFPAEINYIGNKRPKFILFTQIMTTMEDEDLIKIYKVYI